MSDGTNNTEQNAEGGTRNSEQDGTGQQGAVQPFDEWAVVELMGRAKVAGKVTESVIAGGQFLRVDVPDKTGAVRFSRFFSPKSIYSISPCNKQIAIGMALAGHGEPVHRYQLNDLARSRQLPLEGDDE